MRKILRAPLTTTTEQLFSIKSGQIPTEITLEFPRRTILKAGDVLFFEDVPCYLLDKPQWNGRKATVKLSEYPGGTPLEFDMFYFRVSEIFSGMFQKVHIKQSHKNNCFTAGYDRGKFTYSPWLTYTSYHAQFDEFPLEEALQYCVYEFTALYNSLNASSPETYETYIKNVIYPDLINIDEIYNDINPDMIHKKLGQNTAAYFKFLMTINEDDEYPCEIAVTWQMLREWGVSIDELYQQALSNAKEFLPQYCEAKALSWDYSDNDETPKIAKIQCRENSSVQNISFGIFLEEIQDIVENSGLSKEGEGWYCVPMFEGDIYVVAKSLVDCHGGAKEFLGAFSDFLERCENIPAGETSLELFKYVKDVGLVSRGVLEGSKAYDC